MQKVKLLIIFLQLLINLAEWQVVNCLEEFIITFTFEIIELLLERQTVMIHFGQTNPLSLLNLPLRLLFLILSWVLLLFFHFNCFFWSLFYISKQI